MNRRTPPTTLADALASYLQKQGLVKRMQQAGIVERSEERRVGKGGRRRGAEERWRERGPGVAPTAPRFFSSRRRHTRFSRDWSADVCSSDLGGRITGLGMAGRCSAARDSHEPTDTAHHPGRRTGELPAEAGAGKADAAGGDRREIGRASCRERGAAPGGGGAVEGERSRRRADGPAFFFKPTTAYEIFT